MDQILIMCEIVIWWFMRQIAWFVKYMNMCLEMIFVIKCTLCIYTLPEREICRETWSHIARVCSGCQRLPWGCPMLPEFAVLSRECYKTEFWSVIFLYRVFLYRKRFMKKKVYDFPENEFTNVLYDSSDFMYLYEMLIWSSLLLVYPRH